jgi:hypothetical protein
MTTRSRVIDFHQVKGHPLPLGKYEKLGMRPVATSVNRRATLAKNPVVSHQKGPESVYDEWNISVVICYTNIP